MLGHSLDPNSPVPRYHQIYSVLLGAIKTGVFEPGDSLPPERQIAEDYGVARLTVTKALDLLERDGLIDRQLGRGTFVKKLEPVTPSPKSIAFVSSPSITHDLMAGISQTAFDHHYHLQILGVDLNFKRLDAYLEACLAAGVEGFLIYARTGNEDEKALAMLLAKGIPVVMVDRFYPTLDCDYVVYNNEEASFTVVEKLIERGHQRIAIIPGFELETSSVQHRLSGYRKALEHCGILYDEELVWLELYCTAQPAGIVKENYQRALWQRLEAQQPTAIVTINENISDRLIHDLFVLQKSQRFSQRSIEAFFGQADLELATFSDRLREDQHLDLVAVHPTVKLGQTAAKLLIDRLNNTVKGSAKHMVIPMDLLELPRPARQRLEAKEV